jgi:hypothetical protein
MSTTQANDDQDLSQATTPSNTTVANSEDEADTPDKASNVVNSQAPGTPSLFDRQHGAPSRLVECMFVIMMLMVYFSVSLNSSLNKSLTFDESIHMTAGLTYWTHGDFRLQPENGNLPQRLAGLLLKNNHDNNEALNHTAWGKADTWGSSLQYVWFSGHKPNEIALLSRTMMAIVGVVLGLVVFLWTRKLMGALAAMVALTLYALSPTMLAHGRIASSDLTAALCFFATAWALCSLYAKLTPVRVVLVGVLLGCSFCAKFSGVLLLPVFACVALGRLLDKRTWTAHLLKSRNFTTLKHRTGLLLGSSCTIAIIAIATLWGFYDFRYSAVAPDAAVTCELPWDYVISDIGKLRAPVEFAREKQLLPEAFLWGFSFVIKASSARKAFFAGNYSAHGWKLFFPTVFAVKTALPILIMFCVGIVTLLVHSRNLKKLWVLAPAMWCFLAIYSAAAITSHLNIGHRHLLPIYPFVFLIAGASVHLLARTKIPRFSQILLLIIPIACLAKVTFGIYPHYISFFNSFAGGERNGHELFVDSSYDWGQDLLFLRDELENSDPSDKQQAYLSYFGTSSPSFYKLDVKRMAGGPDYDIRPSRFAATLDPGMYYISATIYHGAIGTQYGDWSKDNDSEFANLSKLFAKAHASTDHPKPIKDIHNKWRRFNHLRNKKLCHYLRKHKITFDHIGMSIFAFKLDETVLHKALGESRFASSPNDFKQTAKQQPVTEK